MSPRSSVTTASSLSSSSARVAAVVEKLKGVKISNKDEGKPVNRALLPDFVALLAHVFSQRLLRVEFGN